MALTLRRSSHQVRLEMTPLLDVIFLLLTFFIYSQVLLMRPYILPVKLPTVSTSTAAEPAEIVGITVDRFGKLFLNEHPVEWDELRQRLGSLVNQPSRPQVFLAVEDASAEVDRGLMLVRLMDMMRSLGIEEYGLVVQPAEGSVSP